MAKIALRAYKRKPDCKPFKSSKFYPEPPLRHKRVLVFDTETTTDEYLNLKIGYFELWVHGALQHYGLFYDPGSVDEAHQEFVRQQYSILPNVDNTISNKIHPLKKPISPSNLYSGCSKYCKIIFPNRLTILSPRRGG